jgi:preprotein translocase subunit Sec63
MSQTETLLHSIEQWREACARSQARVDDQRVQRRASTGRRRVVLVAVLWLVILAVVVAGLLITS